MSQYKPYPAYKDSGVRWLGQVPEHWTLRRLKHMARFSGGGTPARDNAEFWSGDIPWVSPKDMKSELITETEECITAAGLAGSSSTMVPAGRVLMVVRSGILKHTIPVAMNQVHVALNQDMKAVWLDSNYLSDRFFLRWVQGLNDDLLKVWLKQGATVESIEQEYLADTMIPVPSAGERERIVEYLDRETTHIDALIEKKVRFIELLREKHKSLVTQAVTKGLNPMARMKHSGSEWLGDMPAHWEILPLKRLVSHIGQGWSPECEARVPEDGEWGVVKVGCVNGGVFRPEESKALPIEMMPRLELSLKAGDVLVSRANTRELVGSCAVVPCDYPYLMLCDKLYRIGCNTRVTPDFLSALITVYGRRAVEMEATGASSSMVNISQSVILDLLVAIPSTDEQIEIISRIKLATAHIENLSRKTECSIRILKERRSALIISAVTGQIDLREAI